MTNDVLARRISVNYDGGSITMSQGNFIDLFGENANEIAGAGEEKAFSVKQHTRTRVIGGASKTIPQYTKQFIQWPTNSRDGASGGEEVVMEWIGSEGPWTCRVTGPLWKLGSFLNNNSPKSVWFHAKGGKGYGPFQKAQ